MKSCIFCKIIKREIPAHEIYEDEHAIGILDLFPNAEGQALIITKNHYPSDFTKMPEDVFKEFALSAKKLAHILKKKLEVGRVAMVIEGMGVDHAHIKLYPMHGVGEDFESMVADEKVYYENYPGFVDSRSGEKASDETLGMIANRIRS
jgi:diadenosine tetraphosphate (Ap4A) HIT family hydrolase